MLSVTQFNLRQHFGFELSVAIIDMNPVVPVKHNWETMKTSINNYIGSLNWGYRVALRDKNVNYANSYAEFIEPHKIKVVHLAFLHYPVCSHSVCLSIVFT